jgi:hypothetical protein
LSMISASMPAPCSLSTILTDWSSDGSSNSSKDGVTSWFGVPA